MRVEFPDENWAELKPVGDLAVDDLADVQDAIVLTGARGGDEDSGVQTTSGMTMRMKVAMAAKVITSWSLTDNGAARPVTQAAIGSLKLPYWRPLDAALKPYMLELRDDKNPNPPAGS